MKTIIREQYLERIKALKDTPDIKIITGIRRSGKSNLMQAYIEYLKSNFEDTRDLEWESESFLLAYQHISGFRKNFQD